MCPDWSRTGHTRIVQKTPWENNPDRRDTGSGDRFRTPVTSFQPPSPSTSRSEPRISGSFQDTVRPTPLETPTGAVVRTRVPRGGNLEVSPSLGRTPTVRYHLVAGPVPPAPQCPAVLPGPRLPVSHHPPSGPTPSGPPSYLVGTPWGRESCRGVLTRVGASGGGSRVRGVPVPGRYLTPDHPRTPSGSPRRKSGHDHTTPTGATRTRVPATPPS